MHFEKTPCHYEHLLERLGGCDEKNEKEILIDFRHKSGQKKKDERERAEAQNPREAKRERKKKKKIFFVE